MSKSRSDQDYDRGYDAGKKADGMDRFVHSHKDIIPMPKQSGEGSYDGGFSDGVKDHYDSDNSHYQGGGDSSSGSGCFITTATLTSIGKPDNCEELNLLREYRDKWLVNRNDGKQLIAEYYNIAPRIVDAINTQPDRQEIYAELWKNDIKPCLGLIKKNQYEEAKSVYGNVITKLKERYLNV